jgi:hypothetical protein
VDAHHAPATREELLEVGAVLAGDGPGFSGEHHEHVGVFQLLAGREFHRALHFGTPVGEQLLPVL